MTIISFSYHEEIRRILCICKLSYSFSLQSFVGFFSTLGYFVSQLLCIPWNFNVLIYILQTSTNVKLAHLCQYSWFPLDLYWEQNFVQYECSLTVFLLHSWSKGFVLRLPNPVFCLPRWQKEMHMKDFHYSTFPSKTPTAITWRMPVNINFSSPSNIC